jgi:hypothetical protein
MQSMKKEESTIVISKEEFEKRFDDFKVCLTMGMLDLQETSQIDSTKALSILKKLSNSLPKGRLLELATNSLI